MENEFPIELANFPKSNESFLKGLCEDLVEHQKDDIIEPYLTLLKKFHDHYKDATQHRLEGIATQTKEALIYSDSYASLLDTYHTTMDTVTKRFGNKDEYGLVRDMRDLFSIVTDVHQYFPELVDEYVENVKELPGFNESISVYHLLSEMKNQLNQKREEYARKYALLESDKSWELDPTYSEHPGLSHLIEREIQELNEITQEYKTKLREILLNDSANDYQDGE